MNKSDNGAYKRPPFSEDAATDENLMVNRFMIWIVRELNASVAVGIIVSFAVIGAIFMGRPNYDPISMAIGAALAGIAGVLVAGLTCGLIAAFLQIERHLFAIKTAMERGGKA
jgi:hypothetical protein